METEQRNIKIRKLRTELSELEEEESKAYQKRKEENKQAVLKANNLTEDQVKEVADNLVRTREVYVFYDKVGENSEFEDDESIHVVRNGIRFCKDGKEAELQGFAKNIERELNKIKN